MSESVKFYGNPDFILREIGGESLLVPVGQNNAFDNSMIVKSKFVCKLLLGTCGAKGCLASLS